MPEEKKTKISDIEKFLTKTGFILEMKTAELLKKSGYTPTINQYFLDLEGSKKREIDIIAKKIINKIQVNLIIECKQSLNDDWIFICSDKKPPRYYNNVKHSPIIYNLHKNKIFNSLHIFNRETPLAQNYLVFDKNTKKKSNTLQIGECLYKLPKSLIDISSKAEKNVKNIFFPIGLFNGQIFIVKYDESLIVEEKNLVQYFINFESKFYKHKKGTNRLLENPIPDISLYNFEDTLPEENELENIIEKAELIGPRFQIDFITEQGFEEYLQMIEKEIKTISAKKWSFNTIPFRLKRPASIK